MCESLRSLSTRCASCWRKPAWSMLMSFSSDFTPSACSKLQRTYKHCCARKRLTANQKCNMMFLIDNSESWSKESCGQEVWGWTSNISYWIYSRSSQQDSKANIQLHNCVFYVPCRCSVEVSEVWVKDSDAVVAHHVDEVYVSQSGSELPDHLPPVLQQHGVQLAFIPAQRDVPGQDVVSVGQVEHCGEKDQQQAEWSLVECENRNIML